MSQPQRKRRKTKDVTPRKPWRHISLTGFYIEQELLKAKKNGKQDDEDELTRIASDASEMFGAAVGEFNNTRSALRRVKRDRARLAKGGWQRRPVKAVVTKL